MDTERRVRILLQAIINELRLGTKHWDGSGKLLTTPLDIIEALMEGPITFETVPERRGVFQGYDLETAVRA